LALDSAGIPEDKAKECRIHAQEVAPPPREDKSPTAEVRIGYAEGYARQGKLESARKLADTSGGKPEDRLRARAAIAAAMVETRPAEAVADLEQCIVFLDKDSKDQPPPKWLMLRLVEISIKSGRSDFAQRFTQAITDPSLTAWAQLEMVQAKLRAAQTKKEPAENLWAEEVTDPNQLARDLAWMEIARHNTRVGDRSRVYKDVNNWSGDREKFKPFGFAGIALAAHED
jgi:ATP/maltotriose-dependent transcriptional regulator MalT